MRYSNILDAIGNTPLVEIKNTFQNPGVRIYAKLEGDNPGGSIKDRIAKSMVEDAQKKGLLNQNNILLEATSGNTGISLAMIAAITGYRFVAVMPENVSLERRKLLRAFGAEIILTDGSKGTNGAIETAREIVQKHDYYLMLDQFTNTANVRAHYETTGPEIIKDVPEITAFVAGMGTGGTLMGVRQKLKEHNPDIKIIGVEPQPDSKIQGLRNMEAYTPPIYNEKLLDLKLPIPDREAFHLARELYLKEGISAGISSGAALWGAIEYSKTISKGNIVTIFPDRGDKYLSTELFEE
ncbi:MAG: cysteine synthase family protein [Peptococcaceae bacterium]|nr:MAG: cysteine synthase family protein [Peptococcaceae bacterium]